MTSPDPVVLPAEAPPESLPPAVAPPAETPPGIAPVRRLWPLALAFAALAGLASWGIGEGAREVLTPTYGMSQSDRANQVAKFFGVSRQMAYRLS